MKGKEIYNVTVSFMAEDQCRVTELLNSLTMSTGIKVTNFEMNTSADKATFDECFAKIQELLYDDSNRGYYSKDMRFKVQYRDDDTNGNVKNDNIVIIQCWQERGFWKTKHMFGTRFEIERIDDHEYTIRVFLEVGINQWAEDIDQRNFFNSTLGEKDRQYNYAEIASMIFAKKIFTETLIRCLDVLDLIKD